MISNDRFVATFGTVAPKDGESLIALVSNAVREGFAIVLCRPGDKVPLCTLSEVQRKKANEEAKEAAFALGDQNWAKRKHSCGLSHAMTVASVADGDPKKVRAKVSAIIRRITKIEGELPNIGVHLGLSRVLVVDMDTAAEVTGFKTEWLTQTNEVAGSVPDMTVKSPGKRDVSGNWIHKDGGHFWFMLPDDVELPSGQTAIRDTSGWVAMWGDHQVLVPPSVRSEGAYTIIGGSYRAPDWLIAKILHEAHSRMKRVADHGELPDGTGDIDQWSASTSWADLLIADGWTDTGLPDRCSCPIWTAPGLHASPKSATAHDTGCDRYDTSPGHAPLHVWTDNPPEFLASATLSNGSKTFTKLQYVAWRDYAGSQADALVGLGFNHATAFADLDDFRAPEEVITFQPGQSEPETIATDEDSDTGDDEQPDWGTPGKSADSENGGDRVNTVNVEDDDSWKTIQLADFVEGDEEPTTILPRDDYEPGSDTGVCLMYKGKVHSFSGESESGKSWILQAECVRLAKERKPVLWLDFENDARTVVSRFRALGATNQDLGYIDFRNPESYPKTDSQWFHGMFASEYEMAVIDGTTDALGVFRFKSSDNDDVGKFIRVFARRLARTTGAAVALIDHVVKDSGNRGRYASGAGHKLNGLDGAAYSITVVEPMGRGMTGVLMIAVGKDKGGYVRPRATGFDAGSRLSQIGVYVIDATDPRAVRTSFQPPADPLAPAVPPEGFEPEEDTELLILRALRAVEPHGFPSFRALHESVGGKTALVREVTERLAKDGMIHIADAAGTKPRLHRISSAGLARVKLNDHSTVSQDRETEGNSDDDDLDD